MHAETVSDTSGGGVWNAQSDGFYYTRVDANHRPSRLFYHQLGRPESEDRLIREEKDPGFFLGVGGSTLNDFIFIDMHDHETSEIWLLPANDATAEPKLVAERQTGVEYSLTEGGDVFYILTNADGAKDFKIMSAPVSRRRKRPTGPKSSPTSPDGCCSDIRPIRITWSGSSARTACPALSFATAIPAKNIPLPSMKKPMRSVCRAAPNMIRKSSASPIRSMTTPTQLYDYNMRTRERHIAEDAGSPIRPQSGRLCNAPPARTRS